MAIGKGMKYIATPIKTQDLKPGDLFSVAGSEFWEDDNHTGHDGCVGHKVWIRTENTPKDEKELDMIVYKITVVL